MTREKGSSTTLCVSLPGLNKCIQDVCEKIGRLSHWSCKTIKRWCQWGSGYSNVTWLWSNGSWCANIYSCFTLKCGLIPIQVFQLLIGQKAEHFNMEHIGASFKPAALWIRSIACYSQVLTPHRVWFRLPYMAFCCSDVCSTNLMATWQENKTCLPRDASFQHATLIWCRRVLLRGWHVTWHLIILPHNPWICIHNYCVVLRGCVQETDFHR